MSMEALSPVDSVLPETLCAWSPEPDVSAGLVISIYTSHGSQNSAVKPGVMIAQGGDLLEI